jgi:hypothetical protein
MKLESTKVLKLLRESHTQLVRAAQDLAYKISVLARQEEQEREKTERKGQ